MNPTMKVTASEGDLNGSPVFPGSYMTVPGGAGMMIQPDGQSSATGNINADSICIVDEAHFELPIYSTSETSWYSSSSEDIEAFYQLDQCNISHGHSHPQSFNVANSSYTLYRQSAFGLYLGPYTHSVCVKNGRENLAKRSFKFLRKIDEKRKEVQRFSQAASIQEQHEFNASFQNKAAFHHMIAERNRRVKLKQYFSLLHSLLPHKSKKDKHSILSNTYKYMSELKRRVNEQEERNRALEESLRISISNKEECRSFDQRHEGHQAVVVYRSDEENPQSSRDVDTFLDQVPTLEDCLSG